MFCVFALEFAVASIRLSNSSRSLTVIVRYRDVRAAQKVILKHANKNRLDAGTWALCILQFLRTRCRARSRRTCKDEVRKAVAGGIQQTARVDFVRHDPGAEILAVVNRFAVNKPGDMRSAVAREVVGAAG